MSASCWKASCEAARPPSSARQTRTEAGRRDPPWWWWSRGRNPQGQRAKRGAQTELWPAAGRCEPFQASKAGSQAAGARGGRRPPQGRARGTASRSVPSGRGAEAGLGEPAQAGTRASRPGPGDKAGSWPGVRQWPEIPIPPAEPRCASAAEELPGDRPLPARSRRALPCRPAPDSSLHANPRGFAFGAAGAGGSHGQATR